MIKILISIQSYHRVDMLIEGLVSVTDVLQSRLDTKFPGKYKIVTHSYVQDVTDDDIAKLLNVNHEVGATDTDKTHYFTFKHRKDVTGETLTSGSIYRMSYILTTRVISKVPDLSKPDFIIFSDDDFIIRNNNPEFERSFDKMITHMLGNNIMLGAAKLSMGQKEYDESIWDFTEDTQTNVPFKERFTIAKYRPFKLNMIFSSEMDKLTVGEDLYTFLKTAVLGESVGLYKGLTDYVHIQFEHVDRGEAKSSVLLPGGFAELVYGKIPENVDSYEDKYEIAAKNGLNCQSKFPYLFRDDSKYHPQERRVDPNLLDIVGSYIELDENNNIVYNENKIK